MSVILLRNFYQIVYMEVRTGSATLAKISRLVEAPRPQAPPV
jgi:hypothetical protein